MSERTLPGALLTRRLHLDCCLHHGGLCPSASPR